MIYLFIIVKKFFENLNIREKEIIIISGTKNIICLISSYKFTLKMINKAIIKSNDKMIECMVVRNKEFFLTFFSTKGYKNKPNKISNGSLKNIQIGIYVAGKFCAFIHSPKVIVQTVCKC